MINFIILKKAFSINKCAKSDENIKSSFSNVTVITFAGKIHEWILKSITRNKIFVVSKYPPQDP